VHDVFSRLGFDLNKFEKSGIADELFEEGLSYKLNKEQLVIFGLIRKKELKRFDLKQDVFFADFNWEKMILLMTDLKVSYKEVPKFPEVRRDLALVLEKNITYEELEQAAYQAEKRILRNVSLFDIYEGEKISQGKKSYALSFLLRDDEKTLTDDIIEKSMDRILKAFQEKFNATIR
jgi:phenylalanyl-tRNA synthetase beta chain